MSISRATNLLDSHVNTNNLLWVFDTSECNLEVWNSNEMDRCEVCGETRSAENAEGTCMYWKD
jgi:hypothetical protein